MLAKIESTDRHVAYRCIEGIDDVLIDEMKNKFFFYKKRQVILASSFEDMKWRLSDQVHKRTVNFEEGACLISFVEEKLDIPYEQFVLAQKLYVMAALGSFAATTIYMNHRYILRFLQALSLGQKNMVQDLRISNALSDFWDILPQNTEFAAMVQNYLDDYETVNISEGRRHLAPFISYFRFQEAMDAYWAHANRTGIMKYFPLWLWWNLTMILPLRVTEFTLLPRNCLSVRNGQVYLSVRRTALKKRGSMVGYSIDADYTLHSYRIPRQMHMEIQRYLDLTEAFPATPHDLLFRSAEGYAVSSQSLRSLLHEFYSKEVSRRFEIVQADDELADDQITPIRLGDTRHLAMISLILQGGSPIVCKELADHEDIAVSAHYYGNISELVKCVTYEVCRKKRSGGNLTATFHRRRFSSEFIELEGGRCYSPNFLQGSCADCLQSWPPDGVIGTCQCCDYFVPANKKRLTLNLRQKEQEVDNAFAFLCMLIEQVRKHKIDTTEILRAMNQLGAAAANCQYAYEEVYADGKTKEISR